MNVQALLFMSVTWAGVFWLLFFCFKRILSESPPPEDDE